MRTIKTLALSLLLVACGSEDSSTAPGSAAEVAATGLGNSAEKQGGDAKGENASESTTATAPAVAVHQGPKNPLGFEVWNDDFPFSPHLSPHRAAAHYDLTRKQALEQVVGKLQGNCSKPAWNFSKDFARRFPADDLELLVEAMERNFTVPHMKDVVKNTVDAMGFAKTSYFAPALLRALEHREVAIQNAAMKSLIYSGSLESVRAAYKYFDHIELLAQRSWIRAAAQQLGDEVVDAYSALLLSGNPIHRSHGPFIIEQAMALPLDLAYKVLKPLWRNPTPQLRAQLAGILHRHGDGAGTVALKVMLEEGGPQTKVAAIRALGPEQKSRLVFIERLLILTMDPAEDVRTEVVRALRDIPDERIDRQLEVMTVDAEGGLRNELLSALRERGVRGELDRIIADLPTASGTRLYTALSQLVAAHDGQAVAAMEARMRKEPKQDWKDFMRAIGHTTSKEAFATMSRIFCEDQFQFGSVEDPLSSWSYASLHMVNSRGAESDAIALYKGLATDDYVRRSYAIYMLASVAADRADPAVSKPVYDLLRALIIDKTEIPQLRLLALEYLRRDLRIEDARKIKRILGKEKAPMRAAFTDFLFEFF